MKSFARLLGVAGLLLMAGYGVAVCDAQTPPVRIMPLGDSLTLGNGSGTSVEGGYRNKLYSVLTTAGFNVDFVGTQTDATNPGLPDRDHQGMGGYRIEQIQSGLTGWLNVIEDPDVILLMIGTNDFTQNFNLASAQTRLTNLVADLATKRPFAKIILSNLPLRTDNPSLEALQVTFNASIPGIVSNQVSLGRQVSFVDMHSALVASDLNDGVHPKLAGYDKMANVWFSAITSVITPLGTSNPPAIVRIEPLVDKQHVTVKFSKPVADSATNLANFSLTGGLTISQAVLDAATKRYITLTTSTQTPETLYTLTVSGVRDRTAQQNLIAAGSTVTFTPGVLVNGSFEADFTGWTTTGNQFIATGAPYLATDGTKLAAFNGGNLPPNAVLAQAFATTVGQTYTLAFDAGVLAYNTNSQTIQVTVTGAGSLLSQTITLIGAGGGTNRWLPQSFTFVANSTAATLTFRDQSTSTNGLDLLLDNVRITATVSVPNTAPVAVADAYSTSQDIPLTVPPAGVLANDTDAQSNPLTAIINASPSQGSVTLNANGGFTYTPAAGYTGADSFTYHANDGSLNSNIVTVSITVNALVVGALVNGSFEADFTGWTTTGNQFIATGAPYLATDGTKLAAFNGGNLPPNAVLAQSFATTVGQTYTLAFDAGVLAYNTNSQTIQVTVTGAGSLLSRTITLIGAGGGTNRWLPQSFTFVANSTAATLTFRDQSASTNGLDLLLDNVRITATVSVPNTAPVAVADAYSTSQDTPLTVPPAGVLANDTDAQSNPLTAIINAGPGHGSVTLNANGGFTYTPAAAYTGADSFTYHANDGSLNSNIVAVTITVNALVAGALANGSFELGDFVAAFPAVPFDHYQLNSWTVTGNPVGFAAVLPSVPATDGSRMVIFNGASDSFDGTISQTFATTPGATYQLEFDIGIIVAPNLTSRQQLLGMAVNGGSLLSQDVTLTCLIGGATQWTAKNYSFTASSATCTLSFTDKSGTLTAPAANDSDLLLDNVRITATVSVPNTAPVAVADAYSTSQDTPLTVPAAGVLANDTDAQTNSLVAIINAGPGHGSVTLNANGGFTYIPAAGYTGADSFTYHANDGNLNSNIVTVSITVNALVAGALVNGSFEADFTGWTTTGNQFIATAAPYAATDGTKLVAFNGGNLTPNAVLSQSFATTVAQTYTLAFDAGVLAYNTNSQTIQVTVTGAGSLLSRTITLIGAGGGTNRWLPQSFTFVANSTAATLTFRDQSTSTNSLDLLLDNVRITATASALASLVPQEGFNGTTSSLTTSQAAITPPPASLGTPSLSGTPGNITLRMTAPAAGNYVLERSEDLKTWEYVSEMQCAAQGLVEFHDTQNSFSAQRPKKQMFYRIGHQPDVPSQ